MNVETTTQTEEMAKSILNFSTECLAILRERREKAAACLPVDEELARLAAESAEIDSANQGVVERLAAAERLARIAADELVLKGENSEARATLSKAEEVKAEATQLAQRKRAVVERISQLETEKRAALYRSAVDFRDSSIALIRAAEASLAGVLDQTRDTLNTLETALGTELYRPDQLTADEKSSAWRTLHLLYFGSVRG